MTLRTEAGESVVARMRLTLREPTGSPVVRYEFDDAAKDLAGAIIESRQVRRRALLVTLCLPQNIEAAGGDGKSPLYRRVRSA